LPASDQEPPPIPVAASPASPAGWFLEDALPGTVLLHPHGRTIDEAEHVWLAWITNNVSDIHGDAHAASRTSWGQPIVLGALTAAIVIGLAAPAAGDPATSGTAGWDDGWISVRLTGAVLPGDTIRAESIIHARIPRTGPATGRVRRTILGRNQRDEVIATIEESREVARRT
jgi:acyl dehydratase